MFDCNLQSAAALKNCSKFGKQTVGSLVYATIIKIVNTNEKCSNTSQSCTIIPKIEHPKNRAIKKLLPF